MHKKKKKTEKKHLEFWKPEKEKKKLHLYTDTLMCCQTYSFSNLCRLIRRWGKPLDLEVGFLMLVDFLCKSGLFIDVEPWIMHCGIPAESWRWYRTVSLKSYSENGHFFFTEGYEITLSFIPFFWHNYSGVSLQLQMVCSSFEVIAFDQ